VTQFCKKNNFELIADLGCNDGEYSILSLKNGCKKVIGFDFDINAINKAYKNSNLENLHFLPLHFDATNPSANIGWYQKERKGFIERANFNAIIALAFEHHLAIAKNIPLNDVISWLVSLAPTGLIEFVPKEDETIKKMLEFKGDIFPEYTEENFEKYLLRNSKIISKNKVSSSGRTIYEYKR
jgi:ribosomal protein L11 methylase PrmA